jgi:kinesin family member 2/24
LFNRVKSLSKSGNPKKDSGTTSVIPSSKETATGPLSDDPFESVPLPVQDFKPPEFPKRDAESFQSYPSSSTLEPERTSVSMIPSYTGITARDRKEERDRREEKVASISNTVERERVVEGRNSRSQQVQSMMDRERVVESRSSKYQQAQNLVERERVETRSKLQSAQNSIERENAQEEEKVPKVSPPRRKGYNREERIDKQSNLPRRDNGAGPGPESVRSSIGGKQSQIPQKQFQEKEVPADDGDINAILEVKEMDL